MAVKIVSHEGLIIPLNALDIRMKDLKQKGIILIVLKIVHIKFYPPTSEELEWEHASDASRDIQNSTGVPPQFVLTRPTGFFV